MIENTKPSEHNDTESSIERVVMRRIHLIRVLRLIISTMVLAALTATAALWGIGREVWVARVFQNAPSDFAQLPSFLLAAFGQTRFIVQVLAVLTFASFAYLLREAARLFIDAFVFKSS